MQQRHLSVYPDIESLTLATAQWLVSACTAAMEAGGRCTIALSGGSTPKALFRLLATDRWRVRFDWRHIELCQVDERVVPIDDPANNFGMIQRELLHSLEIPKRNLHRIVTELGTQAAAEQYESELRELFAPDAIPRFDVLLMGMGDDGHTASLFPGTAALQEKHRLVLGYHVEKLNSSRITLTLPVINNAARILFQVEGAHKAAIAREVLEGNMPNRLYPAAMVMPSHGELYWYLDREAATLLDSAAR